MLSTVDGLAAPEAATLIAAVQERRDWTTAELAAAVGVTTKGVRSWVATGLSSQRRVQLEQLLAEAPRQVDIRSLRSSWGWTQVELAERLGVAERAVIRWEAGGRVPERLRGRLRELAGDAPNPIQAARERSGLTQAGLARALGISASLVSLWERGQPVPPAYEHPLAALEGDDEETMLDPAWICARREFHKLSGRRLAKLIGVQPPRVGEWEQGKRPVPPRHRWALRRVLGAPKAKTGSRDAEVLEVVRSEPGLSLRQLLQRFPAHNAGAVQGALDRHVFSKRLYRAKGTVTDRLGRPRHVWRFYPDPQESERVEASMTGAWLRRQLLEIGWTHEALARELGVTREAVRYWTKREQQPIPAGRQVDMRRVLANKRPPSRPRQQSHSAMPDLRSRRQAAGLTQAELAEWLQLNRGQSAVSAWERGVVSLNETTAERITAALAAAKAAGVTGSELRAGRERAGWTQAEFAKRLDVTRSRLRRWELGRSPIPSRFWEPARSVLQDAPTAEHAEPMPGLRGRRKRLGCSQAEMARRLGVWQADVSRWERGAPVPATMRERLERELETGVVVDPGSERRATIVALVTEEPGLSPKLVMKRVGGHWDVVHAELEALEAAAQLHERPTPYTDGAGRVRSRPGLYPGTGPSGPAPTLAGEEIARGREQLGWSQAQLAREMGIAPTIVHRWEHSVVAPDATFVRQLERVFAEGQRDLPEGGAERLAQVGGRLRPVRERLGFSVSEMARRLGVDRGTLADWEAGVRPVSSGRRRDLLALLDRLEVGAGVSAAGG